MAKVIDVLVERAQATPDLIAFDDDFGSISYLGLAQRVAGAYWVMKDSSAPVGLMAGNSIDWVVADLAVTATGRRLVPMPPFFSDEQLDHVVSDSGVELILCDAINEDRAARFSRTMPIPNILKPSVLLMGAESGQRVIYTSGSTGQPKGVRHGDRQIDFVSQALAEAISATSDDHYLSVLPFPLLLEELCGIHVPILVGGSCSIRAGVAPSCASGDIAAIGAAFDEVRPSVSVLVPELLRAWVGALLLNNGQAPAELRLVAVGGAPVPPQVLDAATHLGIPCLEGYGLSECGSVVALNPPGANVPGSVGKPLASVKVEIVDGEIVVETPAVMDGYLGRDGHVGPWRTGDLGHFDETGNLVIEGRRDALLVTSSGRNIQPEWIEAQLQGDPRILRATLTGHGQDFPTAVLVPGPLAGNLFNDIDAGQVFGVLTEICADTPLYARPMSVVVTTNEELQNLGLLSPNGRVRRQAIQRWLKSLGETSRIVQLSNNKEFV